ncbi:MAG: hypothetical protein D6781_08155 [Verrucomicrobia bacterium]|nr:MAG: hypothetical protein D6781_08155 [Verrucomicrobiota bacterium]
MLLRVPLLFALCLLALPIVAPARLPVPFDPAGPLQVVIYDQVFPRADDAWTAPAYEQERFIALTGVLESRLHMAGITGEITFERAGGSVPPATQRLEIILQRWEVSPMSLDTSIVVDCHIQARLLVEDGVFDMGVFRGQDTRPRMRRELVEEDYRPAAEEAVTNMIRFYYMAMHDEPLSGE